MGNFLKIVWLAILLVPLLLPGGNKPDCPIGLSADTAFAQNRSPAADATADNGRTAQILDISGPIGPATSDYMSEAFATAREKNAALIILLMDTPGGLAESMRVIIKQILDSPIPVATYVYPSGARAASAGTYILYASHIAAMAPGTNLGAATPVQIGGSSPFGDKPENGETREKEGGSGGSMEKKIVNDAVAYIRSLAQLRGRNEEWAEKAVRQAASLPAQAAVRENVVDVIASDVPDLLEKIHGTRVSAGNREIVLQTKNLSTARIEPGWLNKVLAVITNPNIALILMLIGVYGLIFELANPGTIGPGIIGVICLLLGFYALNVLPLNYTGLALLILAVILMTAEAFVPSFGVLGIGGVIAFIIGAAILIDTDAPGFHLSWWVIIGTAALSGVVLIFLIGYAWKAHRRPVATGQSALIGKQARVLEWSAGTGYVRVEGERWKARGEGDPEPGDSVEIIDILGLTLIIEKNTNQKKGASE